MNTMQRKSFTRRRKSSAKPFFIVFFVILTIVIGNRVYAHFRGRDMSSSDTSVIPSATPLVLEATQKVSDKSEPTLQKAVHDALSGTKGSYGIVIKNLKTNETYTFQEHEQYETASLYKLWIMATVYDHIAQQKLTETDTLKANVETLNKKFAIASEAAEMKEGDIEFTVSSALHQMITISHNYAALILSEKIKLSTVTTFLKTNGFTESKLGTTKTAPQSTAADIALFYEKLYRGELVNPEYSQKMLSILKEQKKRNKIPVQLPVEVDVAHKTGELGYFSHDAGIVYTPFGEYIVVVLTKTNNPQAANERIAEISKNVYEYFKKH